MLNSLNFFSIARVFELQDGVVLEVGVEVQDYAFVDHSAIHRVGVTCREGIECQAPTFAPAAVAPVVMDITCLDRTHLARSDAAFG